MRGEPCDDGTARLAKVPREGPHLVARDAGVDEQHARFALHDDRVALDALALVDQHTVCNLLQHQPTSLTSLIA